MALLCLAAMAAPTVAQGEDTGYWLRDFGTQKIDDSRYESIRLDAETSFQRFGRPFTPRLQVSCFNNTTRVHLFFESFITIGQAVPVKVRFDDKPPQTQYWTPSERGDVIGLWSGAAAIPFIKALFPVKRLLLFFTPYGESSVTVEFNVRQIEPAVSHVRKLCGW